VTAHTHTEYVEGCFRCDLSADEVRLPPVTERICAECPWARDSAPGWLGPLTADEWLTLVHGEQPIACHTTIVDADENGEGDWSDPRMRQCRGAAIYRANVGKMPRRPDVARLPADTERVFGWHEFKEHHTREGNQ
jgi:hypothetical protein